MNDLSSKKCQCGQKMMEVIGYDEKEKPFRQGWYCAWCKAWDKAILRERNIK